MKITHHVVATGHYVTITDHIGEYSIRTQAGTPEELQDYARELEEKATRLIRDALRLRAAVQVMREGRGGNEKQGTYGSCRIE